MLNDSVSVPHASAKHSFHKPRDYCTYCPFQSGRSVWVPVGPCRRPAHVIFWVFLWESTPQPCRLHSPRNGKHFPHSARGMSRQLTTQTFSHIFEPGLLDYGLVSISVLAAILNGLMHIARLWNTSSHLEAQESCLWTSEVWTRSSQSRLVQIELLCYAKPSVRYDFNLLQLALTLDIGYSPEVELFDVRASLRLTAIVPTVRPGRRREKRSGPYFVGS